MPYKGMEMSMLIFLPEEIEDDTTGLEKVGLPPDLYYTTQALKSH